MEVENQAGLVVFRRAIDLSPMQRRMAEGTNDMLTIDWGDYLKHGWYQLAADIMAITAKRLLIWNNWHQPILLQLKHVSLANLTHLVIRNNLIVSLECLVRMDCEQLKDLDVADNLLVSTRSLSKSNLRNLETLNIQHNPLASCEDLYKANFIFIQKIEVSDVKRMIERFQMANDPVTWKIKLQNSFQEDQNFYYHHGRTRGFRRYGQEHHDNHVSLNYLKYREMLSQRK